MKRIISVLMVAAFLAGGAAAWAMEEQAVAKTQDTCPVMNAPVNKALYVDHDGKRVYVCCKGCVGEVKKDPAKYIKQLEDAGVTLDKSPAE